MVAGFDSERHPIDTDIAEFSDLARLGAPPWSTFRCDWDEIDRDDCRVRCWLWCRRIEDVIAMPMASGVATIEQAIGSLAQK